MSETINIRVGAGMYANNVGATLEHAGITDGKFPMPAMPEQRAWQPTLSPTLRSVVEHELAASEKPNATATADVLSKHLALDLKTIGEGVEKFLAANGLTVKASDLTPATIAAVHALASRQGRNQR